MFKEKSLAFELTVSGLHHQKIVIDFTMQHISSLFNVLLHNLEYIALKEMNRNLLISVEAPGPLKILKILGAQVFSFY